MSYVLLVITSTTSHLLFIITNKHQTMHLLNILLILLLLSSFSHTVYSEFNNSVIPIKKDAQTSLPKIPALYQVPTRNDELYLFIDLDAPFVWFDCVIRHIDIPCGLEEGCRFPVRCDTPLCKEAKSYVNPICPSLNITDKYGCNICSVTPYNPISNTCKISQLTTDLATIYYTNGRNPSRGPRSPFGTNFVVSCAPKSLLKSFPTYVRGVAGFSWSGLGFPRQLSSINFSPKFGLCLPASTSGLGVTYLGDGPFYFTDSPNRDVRTLLSYTPMVRKSSKSLGYYIKINRILIKGAQVTLPSGKSKGTSVKISTRVPYTVLETNIYKSFVNSFTKALGNVGKVTAVKPFGYCVKDSVVAPKIDLETESGKVWSILGENSLKRVGNGVACLAFVDGGSKVTDPIVIGTFQLENNLLYFDLVNQKLGFSSSLLARGSSCGGFNFTEVAS